MENITLGQTWVWFLAACGAIAVIGGASTWVVKLITAIKKPETKQDEKIAALEKRVGELETKIKDHETFFKNDSTALENLQDGMKILLQGNLALMSHAINGNDIEGLKKEQEKLQQYLLER